MTNTCEKIIQKKIDSALPMAETIDEILLLASKKGDFGMVKRLFEYGANVKYSDNNGDALTWASCYGHLEVVKYLIDKGWNIHLSNDLPIRFASENGHLEVVKFLVDKGADVHGSNEWCLRWSVIGGHMETAKYIAKHFYGKNK